MLEDRDQCLVRGGHELGLEPGGLEATLDPGSRPALGGLRWHGCAPDVSSIDVSIIADGDRDPPASLGRNGVEDTSWE